MKKILLKTHLLLSLPVGIFISVICFTGSMMVYDDELLELFNRSRYYVDQATLSEALPLEQVRVEVSRRLVSDSLTGVTVYSDPSRTLRFSLASGRRSYVYADPYTGEITGYYNAHSGFFWKVQQIHRWFLDASKTLGKRITGLSTIFLILIVITVMAVWWPKSKRQAVAGLTIKRGAGMRRRLIDLHRVLGVYCSLLLILAAVTGLMWSYKWYNNGVMRLFGVKSEVERVENGVSPKRKQTASDALLWEDAIRAAKALDPNFSFIQVTNALEVTLLHSGAIHERASNSYDYNGEHGGLSVKSIYGEKKNRGYIMSWAYVLHVGSWGGWLSKLLTLMMGLVGTTLPLTGYWLYFKRLQRR